MTKSPFFIDVEKGAVNIQMEMLDLQFGDTFKAKYDCGCCTILMFHSQDGAQTPPTCCSNTQHVWKHIPV